MVTFFKLYLLALPIFFLIDMFWLGVIAKNFYRQQLGDLFTKNVNWTAAIVFYLLFLFGIIFFTVVPTIGKNSLIMTAIYGALFGFIAYATYDLTNLATVRNWPFALTIVDMIWGAGLSASVSVGVVMVSKLIHWA